jgi:toxin FitB
MTFLVDTNVISELVRREPDPGVLSWADSVSSVAISVVTVEEIFFGLAWKPNQRIQEWIEQFFVADCRVCPVTIEIARCSGVLRGRFAARGQQRAQADMLIAATAQLNLLTLVTRNTRDFEGCGVALLDPFS